MKPEKTKVRLKKVEMRKLFTEQVFEIIKMNFVWWSYDQGVDKGREKFIDLYSGIRIWSM